MKIIAFGTSNSKQSINQEFAKYAITQFNEYSTELLSINDYQLPIFSIDDEREKGFPDNAKQFVNKIAEADLLIVSLAEHNGSYTAVFKNLLDWSSRIKPNLFDTKMFLLATSPGKGGSRFVLEAAKVRFPRHGATILETFSLPEFDVNFQREKGIISLALKEEFDTLVSKVKNQLKV